MKHTSVNSSAPSRRMRPALSPEAKESQMVSLAMDLVEKRLIDGSASSQETTHFMKIGSSKYQYEIEQLRTQNKLLEAKTLALESAQHTDEIYSKALAAFRTYSGQAPDDDEEDDEDGF